MVKNCHTSSESKNVINILCQAVRVLGQSCLIYDKHLKIEGLLAFTVDDEEVLVVKINETVQAGESSPEDPELHAVLSPGSSVPEQQLDSGEKQAVHIKRESDANESQNDPIQEQTLPPDHESSKSSGQSFQRFKGRYKRKLPQVTGTPSKYSKRSALYSAGNEVGSGDHEEQVEGGSSSVVVIEPSAEGSLKDRICEEVGQTEAIKEELNDSDQERFQVLKNEPVSLGDDENVYKEGNKWHCLLCDRVYSRKHMARYHVQEVHELSKLYKCHLCGYESPRKDTVRLHVKEIHEHSAAYTCPHCDYQVRWEKSLNQHIQKVHGDVMFKCDKCRVKKATKEGLEKHIREAHKKSKNSADDHFVLV